MRELTESTAQEDEQQHSYIGICVATASTGFTREEHQFYELNDDDDDPFCA